MASVVTIRTIGRHLFKQPFRYAHQHHCTTLIISKPVFGNVKYNSLYTSYTGTKLSKKNPFLILESRVHCLHYSDDSKNKTPEICSKKPQKLTIFQRFKKMYKDYWYVLVPVHILTSAVWFGGFYCLAKSGVDIVSLLQTLHFSERITNSFKDSSMGYIAITYALYKIATPARYAVTLGGTTISIQYLTKWGYIKPVPSKERLVEIYQETKEDLKEKKENILESVRETKADIKEKKDNLIETVKGTKRTIQKSVTKEGLKSSQEIISNVKKNLEKVGNVRDQKKS